MTSETCAPDDRPSAAFGNSRGDQQMQLFRANGFTQPVVTYCLLPGLNLYYRDDDVMRQVGAKDYSQVVRQMVADLAEVDNSGKLRAHLEDRLATIACHSVIRANRILEMDEMRALLRALDDIDFATQCPHGRPVLVEISREELERMFKRVV